MGNLKNFLSRIAFEKQASPSKTPAPPAERHGAEFSPSVFP
jgi:hypothetical protein